MIRVILIDDHVMFRQGLAGRLGRLGHRTDDDRVEDEAARQGE